jgi:hypothetical protein
VVRVPRLLREQAAANAQVARMNEIDRVVAHYVGGDSTEVVDVSEHHERFDGPQIGFLPNA